jgi:hypothetical protein
MAVLGDRRAYAEILLEMARAVAPGSGRVAWLGVGIDGSGLLKERIACALSGAWPRRVSAVRKAMVAVSCASAILVAVACRPSAMSSGEDAALEQRDRVLHLRVLQVAESQWRHFADRRLGGRIGRALRARVGACPASRRSGSASTVSGELLGALYVPGRRRLRQPFRHQQGRRRPSPRRQAELHRLLIEHHPESDLAGAVEARIFPDEAAPFFPADPAGYAQAKAAWIAQTSGLT